MKSALCLLFSSILFLFSNANYVLYEVTAFNHHEREILYYLHIKKSSIRFINSVSNEAAIPMDVIVDKDSAKMFELKLITFDIQYICVAEISKEQLAAEKKTVLDRTQNINISSEFYDWGSIESWLDIQKKNIHQNNVAFNKIVIGRTFENRDIFILKINKGPKKPIVFIAGGEDGNDWISSSIILNVLNELLNGTNYLSNLLNLYDFYLLPVLNPDGFVYSREKDRLWTKNRQQKGQKKCQGSFAIGVNIARNWFSQKSSKIVDDECHSIYIGHKALSEEETQTMSYILNSVSLNMLAFIDVRGFGRYITVPYARQTEQANNHNIVMEILKSACTKVYEEYNGTFYYGTTARYFYNFSGNMADWVKKKLNTPLVYTVYLEDVSAILPLPQHILPLSKEFYTILYETLTISKQMYGPLFSGQNPEFYCNLKIKDIIYCFSKHLFSVCLLIMVNQY